MKKLAMVACAVFCIHAMDKPVLNAIEAAQAAATKKVVAAKC